MEKYDKANLLPLTVSAILVLLSAYLSYQTRGYFLPAGVICVTAGIVSIVLNIKWNVDMSFHISEYIIANGISFLLIIVTYAVSVFGLGLFALAISAIIIPMHFTRKAYEKKAAVVMILSTPVLYFIIFSINGIVVLYGNYILQISKA